MDTNVINVGEGLGTVRFGQTKEEVLAILGQPTEKESNEDSEIGKSEEWHYDEIETSVSFEEDFEDRLTTIAISGNTPTLNGKSLIGANKDQLVTELNEMSLGDIEIIDVEKEGQLVMIEESNISFWLEANETTEIMWGPVFDN